MGRSRWDLAVGLLLVAATLTVYAPVGDHEFLNFEDDEYVTGNAVVRSGLTVAGLRWALTSTGHVPWHPLTSLSHMLDVALFGLDASAHLWVNVVLHALATLVLFAVLRAMTGARGPSALVAALFALHPLHVESVAWVADRKSVLSGALWMVTLWRYHRYARRPGLSRYLSVVVVFALALLAEPGVMTLPAVLLLLDWWPLGRCGARAPTGACAWLLVEKLPLLAMAVAASVVAAVAQHGAGAVTFLDEVPLGPRIANVLVAYASYLRKTLWPSDLAPFYPFDPALPGWQVGAAVTVLAGISALTAATVRRRPYLLVGWLWYLGTLVPTFDVVRQGEQALADRFTYLPLVGVFIMIAWGVADVWRTRRYPPAALAAAGAAVVAASLLLTARQVAYWCTSATLFRHTLAVTSGNYLAHTNLGAALHDAGRDDEALRHYAEALAIQPEYAQAHLNFGMVLAKRGEWEAAAAHYAQAVHFDPTLATAEYHWGLLLAEQDELGAACAHYRRALTLDPRYAEAHNDLGEALAGLGRYFEALHHYREALRIAPDLTAAHDNLAAALTDMGEPERAIAHYAEIVRLLPADARARYNLATTLLGQGHAGEAIAHFHVALRAAPAFVEARAGLADAYAGVGRFDEAVDAGEQAAAQARSAGSLGLATEIERRLARYRAAARDDAR